MTSTTLHCPTDFDLCNEHLDAMCGHGAFAAARQMSVRDAMDHFGRGGWVGIPLMEEALRSSGVEPGRLAGWDQGDRISLALIQFTGRWMNPGVPPRVRCQYRHWVARQNGLIWDVNLQQWATSEDWEKLVIPDLMPAGGTGWEVFRSIVWTTNQ